jgi:hypothetical protein
MPPTLKRPAFHCWIAPPDVDPDDVTDDQLELHHVVIHHADQLRAELEANKQGLAKGGTGTPMHLTALWIWANLTRTKRFDEPFQAFKLRCVAYDADKDRDQPHGDPDAAPDELDAHPTEASTS